MWTTSELITAGAIGIAFGSGVVAFVGWLFDQREAAPFVVRLRAPRSLAPPPSAFDFVRNFLGGASG